jgi:predicted transcriptional regulator
MPESIDIALLESAAKSIQDRDARYGDAFSAYVGALETAMAAQIAMIKAHADDASAKHYDRAVGALMLARKKMDDAQADRINTEAMYPQIVRLIVEEIVVVLKRHEELLNTHTPALAQLQALADEITAIFQRERTS